jgi:hypothetical protein
MNILPTEYKSPQSLEEWGGINVFHFDPPWHSKKQVEKLHSISAVVRYGFYPQSRIRERDVSYKMAHGVMNRIAKYRWKHRYFGFPIELKIADALAMKFKGSL